ncbi:hypothetical protein QAD02_013572 [Eretmocerus hayati]|uniref:Uncharacterized protein n=1 Tax=Eretmocerus hayati TaxID=131215 RepID=A0ACC2P2I7_9HYME|nr:hypothetical protein QAD02_013572 [Eretmocerus hayati]
MANLQERVYNMELSEEDRWYTTTTLATEWHSFCSKIEMETAEYKKTDFRSEVTHNLAKEHTIDISRLQRAGRYLYRQNAELRIRTTRLDNQVRYLIRELRTLQHPEFSHRRAVDNRRQNAYR